MSSPAHRHPPRPGPLRLALKRLGLLASAAVFAASVHAAPQDGGVLNLIAQPEPPSLMHGVVTHVSTQYVSGKILQGLLTFDTDLKPKPVLARSWTVSPDGLTYTFELQPDVQWHDGKPFTASDVKFSFGTFYPEVDKRIASVFEEYLDSIDASQPHQVVFHLKKPFAPFLSLLGSGLRPIAPEHLYAGTDFRSNPYNLKPVGTGPFMFAEWKRGAYIKLVKNPNYWKKGLPHLDAIVFHVIPDGSSRAAAFERNDVQVLRSGDADYSDLKRLGALPGVESSDKGWELYSGLAYLQFNTRKPPLNNPKVRQAILYALNRPFIVDNIFFGAGKVSPGAFASSSPYHDPQLPQYGYDLAKAKALIAESGVDVGAVRIRLLNGEKGGAWERLAEYTRQALQPLGFKVQVVTSDAATWFQRVSDWDFDLTYNFIFQIGDPYLVNAYLYRTDYILKTSPFANVGGYSNPDVDNLWSKVADTPEGAERTRVYSELEHKLNDDLPVAPIFEMRYPTLFHSQVKNLLQTATSLNEDYESVYLDAPAP
ncbi:ABC transporter substrate-binding protein [Pseudomonas helleri]|jgi:peptide/nickel transport system substrate-binding protein|uniref:ABC transporter substrate-binding protein n=1 Tax=Pseudomonas helleri TaxID=1608996 RepID=UPI001297568B|nr:ABC transporter substrate-binding protein [Pseudomonas helleri]MQT36865.1 ABC transporter substrate-binding protein [Pseudomonas helleri]MQU23963.1 ABC transporter substrate-binding protein [Pseudomonas helleri]MQU60676.1 ABC transporter substrate-binding protein [Pseudomonas helleri]